jgi:hypothetical protein
MRRDNVWSTRAGGYIEPIYPGYNILVRGSDKYVNFNTVVGETGYGFRDNSGTMQFKNSDGEWVDFNSVDVVADEVLMDLITGSTYDSIQDWVDTTQSSGVISGGVITDDGDGTISVSAGTGFIRASNSATASIKFFDFAAYESGALTEDTTTYIYVDYNSGSPTVGIETSKSANGRTKFYLGKAFREGTECHVVNAGQNITELLKRVQSRFTQVEGEVVRASGYVVAEKGERYLTTTDGVLFAGLTRLTTTAIDTTGADTFEYYYYDGDLATPAWVENDASQIDNANYNDVATGLTSLSSNRYGVHWVYGDPEGNLMVVYGQGNYRLNKAEAAQPPNSLPNHIEEFGFLAAKIIVKEGEANLLEVSSAYSTLFTPSAATNHSELAGLLEDDHTQYSLISSGDGAPSSTPSRVGAIYVDTTGDTAYVAVGTTDSDDWFEVGSGGVTDHGALTGLEDDDHTQYSLISSGDGAPSSTPTRVGAIYIDTTNDKSYIAVDTTDSGDWLNVSLADLVDDTTPQLGGNLDVNGNKITSVSNGDIDIEPNGTGNVLLGNFTFDADQTVGAGQDDYVLTYDNSTGLISLEAAGGGGGGGAWEVVADTTVTGSAVSEIEVTGLDLEAAQMYKIFWSIKSDIGSDLLEWRYNGIETAGSYRYQRIRQQSSTVSGAALSSNLCAGDCDYNDIIIAEMIISKMSGTYPMGKINVQSSNLTGKNELYAVGVYATTNMTSFSIASDSGGNEIAVGSRLTILKLA